MGLVWLLSWAMMVTCLLRNSWWVTAVDQLWDERELEPWSSALARYNGTDAISSVLLRLANEPETHHTENLRGLFAFADGTYMEAVMKFERACRLTLYTDRVMVSNWFYAVRAVEPVTRIQRLLDTLRQYPDSGPLIQVLVSEVGTDRSEEAYSHALQMIRRHPTIYELWVCFAGMHLIRNFIGGGAAVGSDHSQETKLVIYGLSMFPRSPELNLLRAVHLLNAGDQQCAAFFSASAMAHLDLTYGGIDAKHFHTIQRMVSTVPDAEYAQIHCTPYMFQHDTERYQGLYATIGSAVGEGWWQMPNVSTPAGTIGTTNTLIPSSIMSTTAVGAEGGEVVRYIPSLQVGCNNILVCAMPGFLVADAMPAPSTHFLTQTYDLSMVGDASVGLVYSSHTLEHLSHTMPPPSCPSYPRPDPQVRGCASEIGASLSEWRRVLAPGGRLFVSVPDFAILAGSFFHHQNSAQDKWHVMRYMFGGQIDQYDFHKTGFYWEMLEELLTSHGFCNVTKVKRFSLFRDASWNAEHLSLSVHAAAC